MQQWAFTHPKQVALQPPPKQLPRALRSRAPASRYGMVDPGDIGQAHEAVVELMRVEDDAAEHIFGGAAAPRRRPLTVQQEVDRLNAVDAAERNRPMPEDRPHCNARGELPMPTQRCTAETKAGQQCGAKTKHGRYCWNHLRSIMGLRIKPSNIAGAGKGLYAAREFKKGESVTVYTGDVTTDPEEEHGGSHYVFALNRRVTIDAARTNTAPGRLANHASPGNLTWVVNNRDRTVRLVATRAIRAGQELLVSYGQAYWRRAKEMASQQRKRMQQQANTSTVTLLAQPQTHATQLQAEREPSSYEEAVATPEREQWLAAMQAEIESLQANHVYSPVSSLPAGSQLLTAKWVFKRKRDDSGAVVRYKARLVARGFRQRDGIDYDETFAPVIYYKSLRVLLGRAAVLGLELKLMDAVTAFLNAKLDKVIHLAVPGGFTVPAGTRGLLLHRALYGLHQSGRLWSQALAAALVDIGYQPCTNGDQCAFAKRSSSGRMMYIGVFVDDMLRAFDERDSADMEADKARLMSKFAIKDLGDCSSILGMRVTRQRDASTLLLDQEQYITSMCEHFGRTQGRGHATPEAVSQPVSSSELTAADPSPSHLAS